MKNYILLSAALLLIRISSAQVNYETMNFGGQTRQYIVYVPAVYVPGNDVPLLFCLHGLGDNGQNFMNTGFNSIADTANFIAVYPTALLEPNFGGNAWNCGVGTNPSINDTGFFRAMIDTISSNYSVDKNRIYSTGFSLGGFMSQRLACQMNDLFAAIASVSGTIGNQAVCNPTRSLAVMHMHGTNDQTISWQGTFNGFPIGKSVDDMITLWTASNNCPAVVIDTLPDTKSDGLTIQTNYYGLCDDNTEVLLYKINNGTHTWLTAANDVSASVEIWRFLSKHSMTSIPANTVKKNNEKIEIAIYPNPTTQHLVVDFFTHNIESITVMSVTGKSIHAEKNLNSPKVQFDISFLPVGMYIVEVASGEKKMMRKIVISK